jgi:glycine/D-amino acid oxidase-like deaminating enzyme
MRVKQDTGYSRAAATWHPAKWVWCLLQSALNRPNVKLFTHTRVARVESAGEHYLVHTDRGTLRALHVVCATESYTPQLVPDFHDAVLPMQEQAASGEGGPPAMKGDTGISAKWFFTGRYASRVLFGSGGARLPDHEAGCNRPSRFLSKFVAGELLRYFGPYKLHMTNEWSGTVGYTPDEYPIVGLIDGNGYYVIAGMCGSGSAVSFNAGRCIVGRILGTDNDDDYPESFFAPSRLLDPDNHPWPETDSFSRDSQGSA